MSDGELSCIMFCVFIVTGGWVIVTFIKHSE